ncbi:hypothetical protein BJ742DRAFT_834401 [Cladochytrium replicatum]|nr:hypothetical protein BJ742DRAFT_834401 [Cladochytrium replicatum]
MAAPPAAQPAPAEGPAPKCVECQTEDSYFAEAWKVYSKYCSRECQEEHENFTTAMTALKERIAKPPPPGNTSPLSPYEEHDLAPPRCKKCRARGRFFDYSAQRYLDFCGKDGCTGTQVAAAPQQQQGAYSQGAYPVGRPQAGGAGTFPGQVAGHIPQQLQQQAMTKRNWAQPNVSAMETRRTVYNRGAGAVSSKCAHCCISPASPGTSQGLFCTFRCEEREGSVLGAGLMVSTEDHRIVILGKMTRGAYAGLFSFFHDEKRPNELAREACKRIAAEQTGGRVLVTNRQEYTLAQHSTPTVFSYVVIHYATGELTDTFPMMSNATPVPLMHFWVKDFANPKMDRDGRTFAVSDVYGTPQPISRMTVQLVRNVLINNAR